MAWVQVQFPPLPAAAWGDAAVLVPWVLYERTGDLELLRRQYPSMRAWVDQVAELAGPDRVWSDGFQFGDWLDPSAPPDAPADGRTDPYLIATAYHFFTASILGRVAVLLGHEDDAARHAALAGEVREAFRRECVTPSGRLVGDSQTATAGPFPLPEPVATP